MRIVVIGSGAIGTLYGERFFGGIDGMESLVSFPEASGGKS